ADQHVPAIARIDPERVLIVVHVPLAGMDAECLAAVGRVVERDTEHIDLLFIGRIDTDDAEIHRPGVETVDAGPRFAGVGGLVHAAGVFAVGALRLLHIRALTGVHEAIGAHAAAGGIGPAAAAGRFLRPSFERDFNFFRFLTALDQELDFVTDL